MQLSETRYVKIDGTNVTASVNTAAEAKVAIKEVRQKKREYAHIKRGLLREKKAAERIVNAARRKKTAKPGFLSQLATTISKVAGIAGAYGPASATMDLPRLDLECARTDEILHNLDAVQIQIEGKLLRLS